MNWLDTLRAAVAERKSRRAIDVPLTPDTVALLLDVVEAVTDLEFLDEDGDRYIPTWKRDKVVKSLAALKAHIEPPCQHNWQPVCLTYEQCTICGERQ